MGHGMQWFDIRTGPEQISRNVKEDLKQSAKRRNGSISLSSKEKQILI